MAENDNWPPRFTMTPEAAIKLIMVNYEHEQNLQKTELALLRIVNEAYQAGLRAAHTTGRKA